MDNFDKYEKRDSADREEVLSIPVRAGKRTYFFDVKATRSNEFYLTITESKKHFNNDDGRVSYEKHKIFLYKEDFEKFSNALSDSITFMETGEKPDLSRYASNREYQDFGQDVNFDDLGKDY